MIIKEYVYYDLTVELTLNYLQRICLLLVSMIFMNGTTASVCESDRET